MEECMKTLIMTGFSVRGGGLPDAEHQTGTDF